jgi:flagellar FliL protein
LCKDIKTVYAGDIQNKKGKAMALDPKSEGATENAPVVNTKKKLIIIIIAITILAGAAGAAWYFLMNKPQEKIEPKHEASAVPVFINLETFTVNLQGDPDEKFLQLDLSLQVPSAEAAELIKGQMPAVRNRLLMLLSSKSATEISTPEGKKQLSDEIAVSVKKPFSANTKDPEVLGIFFTSFVIQ